MLVDFDAYAAAQQEAGKAYAGSGTASLNLREQISMRRASHFAHDISNGREPGIPTISYT